MNNEAQNKWTKEQHDKAVILWAQGLSITQIGMSIGKSRSAVSARMTRYRSSFPMRGNSNNVLEKETKRPKLQYKLNDVPIPIEAKMVPFIDLRFGECKWILDDFWSESTSQSKCCGMNVVDKFSKSIKRNYCLFHYQESIEKANS